MQVVWICMLMMHSLKRQRCLRNCGADSLSPTIQSELSPFQVPEEAVAGTSQTLQSAFPDQLRREFNHSASALLTLEHPGKRNHTLLCRLFRFQPERGDYGETSMRKNKEKLKYWIKAVWKCVCSELFWKWRISKANKHGKPTACSECRISPVGSWPWIFRSPLCFLHHVRTTCEKDPV